MTIDVNGLTRGQARVYCYKDAARQIRFVLARGNDGAVHAVLDACRQCFIYHQGYRIVGHYLICRVCGNRYPLARMTKGKASCVPVAIAAKHKPTTVTISVANLKRGARYF